MNTQEKIAELEKLEKELWAKVKAIKETPEYKAAEAEMERQKSRVAEAQAEWCNVYSGLNALRILVEKGMV